MTKHDLVVVGGRQRAPSGMREIGDGWYGYAGGVVLRVTDGVASLEASYTSAPGTCGPDDPVLLKSGTVRPGRLHLCTQTEILDMVLPDLRVERHLSLPFFNDVHHVVPTDRGTRLVAVSGIESVVEVADDGTVIDAWHTLGGDPSKHIDGGRDLRQGVDLKPHTSHPNHVFLLGDEPWATRFEQRDAVSLHDPSRTISIGEERIHDGFVHDGFVHFTTVNGHVAVADTTTLEVVGMHALDDGLGSDESLGWVRGLWVADDHAWVGFSRIRFTKVRARVSFLRTGTRSRPTRIARYSLPDWRLEEEIDLEPAGCNAVFTVAPWPA
ncbi:hypothetical protein [Actinospongicola halichondriae]|uniref:hypothetical protein n=1 Tax=Actinospongicola halichondriae TaxID=3236844 RepID=UPI003D447987